MAAGPTPPGGGATPPPQHPPVQPPPTPIPLPKEPPAGPGATAASAKPAPKAPLPPWQPDLTDIAYPPCDARNRGNLEYKPCFVLSPGGGVQEASAQEALSEVLAGKFKLPAGTFDNISGSPQFQYPGLYNPLWRWDATGRQTQWVRP